MRYSLLLLLSLCTLCHGASLYVATNGNDLADGSIGTPWLTIQRSVTNAAAGDTVNVGPGTFNEFVTARSSGTAGNPITFTGTRGSGGEWLTVIDPSIDLSTGWVAASEIGSGVWKQTNMSFAVRELTMNTQRVMFSSALGSMSSYIPFVFTSSGLTTGSNLLTVATDATYTLADEGVSVSFWDGIEALWVTDTTGGNTTYLRLRDGSDPNGLNIHGSPNSATYSANPSIGAIDIPAKSYLTWKNFLIRGAFCPVWIHGTNAHHNVIESNYISAGWCKVYVQGVFSQGSGPHENTIRNNEMRGDYYGSTDLGAWGASSTTTRLTTEKIYKFSKHFMGANTSFENHVRMYLMGSSNVVSGNLISGGVGSGIAVEGFVTNPATETEISGNTVENQVSVGITLASGQTQTRVFGNTVNNCNSQLRFHTMNTTGETNRVAYVYRNRMWLPEGFGSQMFFHWNSPASNDYYPESWVYHNSFAGGNSGIEYGLSATNVNFHAVNNIFSSGTYFYGLWNRTNAGVVGDFAYNLLAHSHTSDPDPAWYGVSNIVQMAVEWSTNSVPTFALMAGSAAIGSALDTSGTFSLNGSTYPALPDSAVKIDTKWDIGALEYPGPPLHVHTLRIGRAP